MRKRDFGSIEVDVLTLDDFVTKENITKVDFIRMDVEAYETNIIKGMKETVKLMPVGALLCIEMHSKVFCPPEYQPPKGTFAFNIAKAPVLLAMLATINKYGFIPKKYCLKHHKVIDVNNMPDLLKLLAEGHCPQVFFEMKKDWSKA